MIYFKGAKNKLQAWGKTNVDLGVGLQDYWLRNYSPSMVRIHFRRKPKGRPKLVVA